MCVSHSVVSNSCDPIECSSPSSSVHRILQARILGWGGVVLRWQRNRTRRPLSPPQIHQKNISMLSKFHKTTSECRQRTSGTQQSRSLASKTGRKKYNKTKKETKEVGRERRPGKGIPSLEETLKKRSFQTPGNVLAAESMASFGSTEGNITGRKNK